MVAKISGCVCGNHGNCLSTAMVTELPFLQMRLRASERAVELLKRKNTGHLHHHHHHHTQRSPACDVTSCQLMSFPVCVSVLAVRVCSTEKMMEELVKQTSGQISEHRSFLSAGVWTDSSSSSSTRLPGVQQLL